MASMWNCINWVCMCVGEAVVPVWDVSISKSWWEKERERYVATRWKNAKPNVYKTPLAIMYCTCCIWILQDDQNGSIISYTLILVWSGYFYSTDIIIILKLQDFREKCNLFMACFEGRFFHIKKKFCAYIFFFSLLLLPVLFPSIHLLISFVFPTITPFFSLLLLSIYIYKYKVAIWLDRMADAVKKPTTSNHNNLGAACYRCRGFRQIQ